MVAMSFLWLIALPWLIILSLKSKYSLSIPARFFLINNRRFDNGTKIWFHACSFGETRSLAPLMRTFDQNEIAISVITQTGIDEAKSITPNSRFLPFEPLLPFWAPKAKLLVVMEAEMWLALFAAAKLRGAKTALISARISDRSLDRYMRFRPYYRLLFSFVDIILTQSEKDKERFERLGAKNVRVCGNIKIGNLPQITREIPKPQNVTVCAGSTHEGEELLVLDAFLDFRAAYTDAKLIIAPRHPERFGEVVKLAADFSAKNSFTVASFSEDQSLLSDITVVDTLGELVNLYAASDVVVLGGAFSPIGGHNPIEPAAFGCRLISGRHIFNHTATFASMENVIFCDPQELCDALFLSMQSERAKIVGNENPTQATKEALDELLQA